MADEDKNNIDEPLSLVNLYLDEIVFVKLRGDRDLVGRLHVSITPATANACERKSNLTR